jgi:signal transduction histidine kinase
MEREEEIQLQRFIQALDKLESTYKTAERILSRKNKLEILGVMAASLAHEMRNPLGGIALHIQMLQEKSKDNPAVSHIANKILLGVNSLNQILENMLILTRNEKPDKKAVIVEKIIDSAIELLGPEFNKKNLQIIKNYNENPCTIMVDPNMLLQAFVNILRNACQSVDFNGKITISTEFHNHTYVVKITDDGPGIPESQLGDLFTPFASAKSDGTGLGLAICLKVIEAHGGTIEGFNNRNKGATFIIKIPQGE